LAIQQQTEGSFMLTRHNFEDFIVIIVSRKRISSHLQEPRIMDQETPDNDNNIAKMIRDITNWKAQSPSIISELMGTATYPITWLVRQLIPNAAIQGALSGFDWVGKNTTTAPGTSDHDDIVICNKFADQVINFHIGVAVAEGGAAGFFGLPAMIVDVPAVILLAMRLIRQIGREYGFEADNEEEQKFVYSVMSSASANSQEEKLAAIATSSYLINLLSKNTWRALAEKAAGQQIGGAAAVIGIKSLAKQLGINITKRSALAAIPVIGAAVGASANGWFVRDVGIAAQNLYQERWLKKRDLWIDVQPSPD
jgi:hypothetical protein